VGWGDPPIRPQNVYSQAPYSRYISGSPPMLANLPGPHAWYTSRPPATPRPPAIPLRPHPHHCFSFVISSPQEVPKNLKNESPLLRGISGDTQGAFQGTPRGAVWGTVWWSVLFARGFVPNSLASSRNCRGSRTRCGFVAAALDTPLGSFLGPPRADRPHLAPHVHFQIAKRNKLLTIRSPIRPRHQTSNNSVALKSEKG
jgi:hypothetical protein